MGLKGPEREKTSPMGSMWYEKVRMGRGRPEVMKTKKVGDNGKHMNPKDENEEIGPGRPN